MSFLLLPVFSFLCCLPAFLRSLIHFRIISINGASCFRLFRFQIRLFCFSLSIRHFVKKELYSLTSKSFLHILHNLLIKNLSTYKQLRPVALELRNAKDMAAFRRQHESQLILYEAAAKALKEAGVTKLPNLYALKTEYKKLDAERERLSAQYSEAKQKLKEYGIVKQNVDSILRTAPGKEHTQER